MSVPLEHKCLLLWSINVSSSGAQMSAPLEHKCLLLWSINVGSSGAQMSVPLEHKCRLNAQVLALLRRSKMFIAYNTRFCALRRSAMW
jgi:hypothetical protein